MRLPDESEGMGVLQRVLDAERRRGNPARTLIGSNLVRGTPPVAQLRHQLGRARVEAEFDLGPLIAWWPRAEGVWDLVDTATGTTICSGVQSPYGWLRNRLARTASDTRLRLGYLADDPVLARSAWTSRRAVATTRMPAEQVAARLNQVGSKVLMSLGQGCAVSDVVAAVPEWLHARCPSADAGARWAAWSRWRGALPEDERSIAAWAARWTVAGWLRAVAPADRTWRWTSATVLSQDRLELTADTRSPLAPLGSLKWMLLTAGVERCGPDERTAAWT